MKIGITVPQFRFSAEHALAAARAADRDDRIDGVFAFDHLWAIGKPDRPSIALWPLLGAVGAITERVVVGSLVARVGLMSDAMVAHQISAMMAIAGHDRFIAGLGIGDHLSRDENIAYGLPFADVDQRAESLEHTARLAIERGAEVWLGGRGATVASVAARLGLAVNLWEAPPAEVETRAAAGPVTWGGVAGEHPEGVAALLSAMKVAGATWVVLAPPYHPEVDPTSTVKAIGDAIAET